MGTCWNTNPLPRHQLTLLERYISERLDQKLTAENLGALIGMRGHNFSQRFLKARGITPHRHVVSLRLGRALHPMTPRAKTMLIPTATF
jgi:transcriptional regulator GlxA family with amidase domain